MYFHYSLLLPLLAESISVLHSPFIPSDAVALGRIKAIKNQMDLRV